MKAQDEARIREQLQHIAQWRASGLPKAQWAAQQGIELNNSSAGSVLRGAGSPA